jgi:hypothetical protein
MKPLIFAVTAAAAAVVLSTTPFSSVYAQPAASEGVDSNAVVGASGNWTLKEREDWLNKRLDMARDDGSIDHAEYDRLHDNLDAIRDQENRMRDAHDGQLTDNQTAALETSLDQMADHIHWLHEDKFQRPW